MPFSMSQSVMESMPTWNDFTDLPDEFLSQFGTAASASIHAAENKKKNCFYTSSFVFFATTMDELLIIACLLATVFNVIVIASSLKLYKEKGDTLHLFILNMTIGDTILTLLCHPYELVTRRYTGTHYPSVTVFLNFANWVGLAVSGLSLTLLNFDKLIFFCWPFKYDVWMSYFRAKLFCYLIWGISIAFATYYWMYSYMYFMDRKIETKDPMEVQFVFLTVFMSSGKLSPINKFFYEAFTLVFCVIPIMSSLFVSCFLHSLTNRKRKLTIGAMTSRKNDYKATSFAFIFATTLWTSCSLLPYRLANLARIHMIAWPTLECNTKQSWSWFTWCMLYLLILNPIINPFITAFAYAPYRQLICGVYVKSPAGKLQSYANKMIYRYLKKEREKLKKESELAIVFHLEIPINLKEALEKLEKLEKTPHGTIRRAPLANLPSICSCGSLLTPDSSNCTRF